MESQQQSVAREERICITELGDKVFASQIPVSTMLAPLIGWGLLTLLVLDVLGNLVGIPILTGSLIGGAEEMSAGRPVFAFVVQLIVLFAAAYALYRSPARFWLLTTLETDSPEAFGLDRGTVIKGKLQSLMGKLSEHTRKLRGEETEQAEDGSQQSDEEQAALRKEKLLRVLWLVVLVLAVAGAAVLVFYFWKSALMLLAIGLAVFFLGDEVLAVGKRFAPRVRADFASILGVLLGAGLAGIAALLIGAQRGLFLRYPYQSWVKGDFFSFRILELFLLCVAVLTVSLASRKSLKYSVFYRAQAPIVIGTRSYYVFDFVNLSAWPVYVQLDPDSLTKVVVLARRADKHYEIIDHSERLALMSRAFTVLNLQALQERIGEDVLELRDSGDFFSCRARFLVLPRSFEALKSTLVEKLGNVLPDRAVGVLLEDLFKSENPRGLLQQLLTEATNEYLGDQQASARDLYEDYLDVRARVREAGALASDQLKVPASLASGDPAGLQMCVVGYEQLRSARESLRSLLDEPRRRWQQYRQRRLSGKEALPRSFHGKLRDHFVRALVEEGARDETSEILEATVDCLLECSGIHLVVDSLEFAEGPAQDCENMVATIDREDVEKQAQIDAEIKQREGQLIEFAMAQVAQGQEAKRGVIAQLIQAAPQVMPFLMQHPAGEKFVGFLMDLGQQAVEEKLGQLKRLEADDPALETKITELAAEAEAAADGGTAGGDEGTF